MENRRRRSSRSWAASAFRMSSPSNRTSPAVGSMRRVMQRTSVDLPLPDRPMTTNISPGRTSNETSRIAIMDPVLARSSSFGKSASGVPITLCSAGPKTFHRFLTAMVGVPVAVPLPSLIQATSLVAGLGCIGSGMVPARAGGGNPSRAGRGRALSLRTSRSGRATCSPRCASPRGTRRGPSGPARARCRTA